MGEEHLALLNPYWLVEAGNYNWSHMSQSTVLVKLAEENSESVEWTVSLKTVATIEKILIRVFNKVVLKTYLRQTLWSTCSVMRGAARDVLSQLPVCERLLSRYSVASNMDLREKKDELAKA